MTAAEFEKEYMLAEKIVTRLNEMLALDPVATTALLLARVPVSNSNLLQHSHFAVSIVDKRRTFSVLGAINGLVRLAEPWAIAAVFGDDDLLKKFEIVKYKGQFHV